MYDVVGLGNALIDILSYVDDDFLLTNNLSRGSFSMVEKDDINRLYKCLPPAQEQSGGALANTIAALAGLGVSVSFLARVSRDQFGKIFEHDMKALSVACPLPPDSKGSTGRSLILITPDAERTMVTYRGSSVDIYPEDIVRKHLEEGRFFISEGYMWAQKNTRDAVIKAADYARKLGIPVGFCLSDIFFVQTHRNEFVNFIKQYASIVFGNIYEFRALFASHTITTADFQELASTCVMTNGSSGSIVVHEGVHYDIDREDAANVVDTTGAGDSYAAGFLYGYLRDFPIPLCGRIAGTIAAHTISQTGARSLKTLCPLINQLVTS